MSKTRSWSWRPPKKKPKSAYLDPIMDEINASTIQSRKKGMAMLPDVIRGVKGFGSNYTAPSNGGYQYSNTPISYGCTHKGDAIIYEKEGKRLHGANGRGLNEYDEKWGLIIDLANQVRYPSNWDSFIKSETTKKMSILKKYLPKPKSITAEILSLNWPDMGIPPVGLDFWLHLWDLLPLGDTVMLCVGGHGRTGTALTAFMIADGVDYYTAIQDVWKLHCEKGVESLSQGLYLHKLYLDVLDRERLEAVEKYQSEDLKSIDAEIEFAKDHAPRQDDLLGGPKKEVKVTGYQGGGSHGHTQRTKHLPPATAQELRDGYRIVAGVYYIEECIKGCALVSQCAISAHQAWVEMDPEEMCKQ